MWLLSDSWVGIVCSTDMLDKGMICVPGEMEQDSARFHHATHNSVNVKTYGLFISGLFHLIFLDCG